MLKIVSSLLRLIDLRAQLLISSLHLLQVLKCQLLLLDSSLSLTNGVDSLMDSVVSIPDRLALLVNRLSKPVVLRAQVVLVLLVLFGLDGGSLGGLFKQVLEMGSC